MNAGSAVVCSNRIHRDLQLEEIYDDICVFVFLYLYVLGYLQDIDAWWKSAELFLTDFRSPPNSAYHFILDDETTKILMSPRSYVTVLNSSKVSSDEELARLLQGADFDSNNRSTAKVYYTVHEYQYDGNYWIFNFNHFYSWNGCSNQAAAISMNGTAEVRAKA